MFSSFAGKVFFLVHPLKLQGYFDVRLNQVLCVWLAFTCVEKLLLQVQIPVDFQNKSTGVNFLLQTL
jgi:hypothetical protein